MRFTLILVTLLHFMPNSLFGQKVSIDVISRYNKPIYSCKTYNIKVTTYDTTISNIILKTNNGKIIHLEDELYYSPKTSGTATIYVYVYDGINTTLIDSTIYNIELEPHSHPWISGRVDDSMTKQRICTSDGIKVGMGIGFHFTYSVHSYQLSIKRENIIILNEKTFGAYFTKKMRDTFKVLQNGDIVRLENVSIFKCDSSDRRIIAPFEFSITKSENYGRLDPYKEYTSDDTFRNVQTGKLFLSIWEEDPVTGEIKIDTIPVNEAK